MFVSTVIEMGIGLAVVYYVVGLIVSFITSQISIAFDMRGRDLYKTLDGALGEKLNSLMDTKLVNSLKPSKELWFTRSVRAIRKFFNYPTSSVFENLSPATLSLALLDGVNSKKKGGLKIEAVEQIRSALGAAEETLQKNVETWVDNVMLSGSALYKENIRKVVIWISLLVTLVLNVDSIAIATYFWREPVARQLAAIEADKILEASRDENGNVVVPENYEDSITVLQDLKIPILWEGQSPLGYIKDIAVKDKNDPADEGGAEMLWLKIIGWLITWAAVSQGSSFWYDTLKRLKGYSSKPEPGTSKN